MGASTLWARRTIARFNVSCRSATAPSLVCNTGHNRYLVIRWCPYTLAEQENVKATYEGTTIVGPIIHVPGAYLADDEIQRSQVCVESKLAIVPVDCAPKIYFPLPQICDNQLPVNVLDSCGKSVSHHIFLIPLKLILPSCVAEENSQGQSLWTQGTLHMSLVWWCI